MSTINDEPIGDASGHDTASTGADATMSPIPKKDTGLNGELHGDAESALKFSEPSSPLAGTEQHEGKQSPNKNHFISQSKANSATSPSLSATNPLPSHLLLLMVQRLLFWPRTITVQRLKQILSNVMSVKVPRVEARARTK